MKKVTQDPLIGYTLGRRYKVQSVLGAGAYGCVYLAVDRHRKQQVAVKALDPALTDNAPEVQRFLDDYRALYQLRHHNIAQVLNYGLDAGRYYIVMHYYERGSLARLIDPHQRFEPAAASQIITQVADGLEAAHQASIVHRDVKPENILLDNRGQVALTDFGVARAGWNAQYQHAPGSGTPDYMSPEQVRGETTNIASDIYSLGVLTFRLLTGYLPFERDNPLAMMYAQLNDRPPLVRQIDPNLSPEIERVVDWALNKDPVARPLRASVFAGALMAALNGGAR
jgi:eukaryotic-like serine/threonine-protein kinase